MPALNDRLVSMFKAAVCLVGLVMFLQADPISAGEPSLERLALVPGAALERTLEAGGVDVFHLELAAAKNWRVRVEQRGIDVVMEVKDPGGKSLLTVDSPLGREGTESLLLTPALTGLHIVHVRCEKQGVPAGRYEIRFDELPAVTVADQQRWRAEEAMTDAFRLYAGSEGGARQQALASLREARGAWRDLGERHQEARTLLIIGSLFDEFDDRRQAVSHYGEALALWRQLNDQSAVAAILDRLGLAHTHLGESSRAVSYLEEALALRRSLGDRGHEAETHNYLCLALQRLGRLQIAGECYEKVLSLARQLANTELKAIVLNGLGGIYRNLGEPARELGSLRQALELQRALGNEFGEAAVLNNLGAAYLNFGEIEEALRLYARALPIFERLENRTWQARVLSSIGFAYLSLGEFERARAYLLRALPLRREVGDKSGESVTLLNLGRTFSGLGETGKALAFFRKALENNLALGNRRGATTARGLIGKLQVEQHEPAAARDELELALTSLRQMGQRRQEAEVLELLSRVHLALGELRPAEALAVLALDLFRAVRDPAGEIAALTSLARVRRELGQDKAVREHLEAALEALETLHERLGDPTQRASFLASQREVYELYVDFLMDLHRQSPVEGYDLAALAASEQGRSRSLLGLLDSAGASLGREVDPAFVERLRGAKQRFTAKTRRQLQVLSRQHEAAEALDAEQELYEALGDLDNVRAEIRRRNPRYASMKRPRTLDATAVRALLDDQTVLLEFLLGEERSFLWWVTPAAVLTFELPPRQAIEDLANQVHQQLSAIHGRGAATRETLQALGQMLLGPIADRLRDQRLVIVADGALHLVPFAALPLPRTESSPDGTVGNQPVLTRHEVVHLPSASVLALQRRELDVRPAKTAVSKTAVSKTAASKTIAIFADPIFDRQDLDAPTRGAARLGLDEFGRLPHTRREAEAIAALVPTDQRLLAMGSDARRSRVVGDELSAYGMIHFATHGFIHPQTPELSGLVLSRFDEDGGELDGFLGLYDVSNLRLSAELVVLSGCHTALGKRVRGEGLVGLTRGFMYAGVPRVVASFWQVRDQATARLMAAFYRAMLVEDLRPAAALRAAQLALRQERRFRDPFYWAAFALQGDWR